MTTNRIAGISVKAPDGNIIGKAVLEVDEGGNVRAHMTLDSVLGRELMTSMEAGIVEGLSFGPVITPTMKAPRPNIEHLLKPTELPPTEYVSLGTEEIESRFGFHKAAIEGPNATAKKHADARLNFKSFAKWFDQYTPPGREKDLAMERLEESSMWFHKAIAKQAPLAED